jgi:MFS family permease
MSQHLAAPPLKAAAPGTSDEYQPGSKFRKYKLWYVLASAALAAVAGSIGGVLLPLHIQQLEAAQIFTAANASLDLAQLTNLKAQVDAGTASATPAQLADFELLAQFEAARVTSLALITGVAVAIGMFVGPIVGALSDRTRSRWGRRSGWIAIGAILGGLLLVAVRYSPTVGVLLITYTLAQVALGLVPAALNATIPDRVPPKSVGLVSGMGGFGTLLGGTLGMAAGGYVFAAMGLDSYFPFAAVLVISCLLFVTFAPDNSSKDLRLPASNFKSFLGSFTNAVRDSDFRWLSISRLCNGIGFAISSAFILYMLQSYVQPVLSAEEAAETFPILTIVTLPGMIVGLFVTGWWSDRVQRRKPFFIATAALFALSMVVPLLYPTLWALYVQGIVGMIAYGGFIAVSGAYVVDLLPDKSASARDLGVANLAASGGAALGPALGGVAVSISGGYQMSWLVAIIAVLISVVTVMPVRRVR